MPLDTAAGCCCPACRSAASDPVAAPSGTPPAAGFALAGSSGVTEIDALVAGAGNFWGAEATFGFPAVVTYSFMDAVPAYYASGGIVGFQPFNDTMKAAARSALAQYEAASTITFVEVPDPVGGEIRFGTETMLQYAGYAYYPTKASYGTNTVGFTDASGDIWISNAYGYNLAPTPGGYGYLTLLHEIGHAVGLKHPFQGYPVLPSSLDNAANTVMSYDSGSSPYTSTLGPLDLQAVRYLYGADSAMTLGNVVIDGDDSTLLVGDADSDYFLGLGGADTLSGGAGDDGLLGGDGADLVFGNEGSDFILANQEADTVYGGRDGDTVYGGQGEDLIDGGLGDDWLIGNKASDRIFGDAGADRIYGGQGDDVIAGGADADQLYGNLGDDTISGGDGADVFAFGDSGGADVVADFVPLVDTIAVKSDVNGSGIVRAADVVAALADVDGAAVLDLGGGNSVTFSGVARAQIGETDILIV